MKIVHCLFTMEAAGAQVLTVGLLNEMCIGNKVDLIIVNGWNEALLQELDPDIRIHYINRKEGARSITPLIKLNLLLMKIDPDIIHCHEPNMIKIIRIRRNAKLFHTVHDIGIPTTFYDQYDSLVAISDAVYRDVTNNCSVPIIRIHNGIPVNAFKRRELYAFDKKQTLKLVQVSRLLHEKKGQDILLRALRHIINTYGHEGWTLDLIGSGASEEYLQKMVNYLQLQDKVKLIGEQTRGWILNNLCNYHILIQPSRYEGFGLTIVEGIAAGLPVLASDIDGPKEIIQDIEGGALFENGNMIDCASKLYQLFKMWETGRMSEIMERSIAIIEERYSMTACAGNYISAYHQSISAWPDVKLSQAH